jgi:hypothetical protein
VAAPAHAGPDARDSGAHSRANARAVAVVVQAPPVGQCQFSRIIEMKPYMYILGQ